MNEYDREYLEQLKQDLEQNQRSDRNCGLLFLLLGLCFIWGVTVAALLGWLV